MSDRGFCLPKAAPISDRILYRVACDVDTRCWNWLGYRDTATGYARLTIYGKTWYGHRLSYETFVGPIPPGLELDHLCRNRACVNPEHLEPVTSLVNQHRSPLTNATKTHCPQGHPYSPENTRYWVGRRYCGACLDARNKARYAA